MARKSKGRKKLEVQYGDVPGAAETVEDFRMVVGCWYIKKGIPTWKKN